MLEVRNKKKLKKVFNSARDATFVIDGKSFDYANDKFLEMFAEHLEKSYSETNLVDDTDFRSF